MSARSRTQWLAQTRHALIGNLPPTYTLRQKVGLVVEASPLGRFWDVVQTFLSLLASMVYVRSTYLYPDLPGFDAAITLMISLPLSSTPPPPPPPSSFSFPSAAAGGGLAVIPSGSPAAFAAAFAPAGDQNSLLGGGAGGGLGADSFPLVPPEVRLLRPLLRPATGAGTGGGVVNGFFVGVPQLLPQGWVPGVGLPMVLRWVRECLLRNGARVRVDTNAFFNVQAFQASRRLFRSVPRYALRHRSGFRREARPATAASIAAASTTSIGGLVVVSATFAEFSMQFALQAQPHFEYGNKVLLSSALLELLMRPEMGVPADADTGSLRARAARMRGAAAAAADEAAMSATSEAAMIFELLSPQGHPVYVGVAEFTSPEPFVIVAPQQVMDLLRVRDGAELTVTRVNLPAATSLVLQPHAADFDAVEALTGKEQREFLEDSLLAYTCLQAGATVLCGGGRDVARPPEPRFTDAGEARPGAPPDNAFRFTVVAVEPAEAGNGAVALFAGFQSEVAISFLPPADAWVVKMAPRVLDARAAEREMRPSATAPA